MSDFATKLRHDGWQYPDNVRTVRISGTISDKVEVAIEGTETEAEIVAKALDEWRRYVEALDEWRYVKFEGLTGELQ